MKLERDKKTAKVEAVKDGKVIGEIVTMGDDIIDSDKDDDNDMPKELIEKFGA